MADESVDDIIQGALSRRQSLAAPAASPALHADPDVDSIIQGALQRRQATVAEDPYTSPGGARLTNPQVAGAFRNFASALQAQGIEARLNSGDRSAADQERLYAARANNPNPVARPGTSNHERGLAADLSFFRNGQRVNPATVAALAAQHGFRWLGQRDPVHFDYRGAATPVNQPATRATFSGSVYGPPVLPPVGPDPAVAQIVQGAVTHASTQYAATGTGKNKPGPHAAEVAQQFADTIRPSTAIPSNLPATVAAASGQVYGPPAGVAGRAPFANSRTTGAVPPLQPPPAAPHQPQQPGDLPADPRHVSVAPPSGDQSPVLVTLPNGKSVSALDVANFALGSVAPTLTHVLQRGPRPGQSQDQADMEAAAAAISDFSLLRGAGLVAKLAEGRFALTNAGKAWLAAQKVAPAAKQTLMRVFNPGGLIGAGAAGGLYGAALEAPQKKPLEQKALGVAQTIGGQVALHLGLGALGELFRGGRPVPTAEIAQHVGADPAALAKQLDQDARFTRTPKGWMLKPQAVTAPAPEAAPSRFAQGAAPDTTFVPIEPAPTPAPPRFTVGQKAQLPGLPDSPILTVTKVGPKQVELVGENGAKVVAQAEKLQPVAPQPAAPRATPVPTPPEAQPLNPVRTWARLNSGKPLPGSEVAGSVESAVQAAFDARKLHSPEDVRAVVEGHGVGVKVETAGPLKDSPVEVPAAPTREILQHALSAKGILGDHLLNALDLADELASKGAEIAPDGMVTLYHRTTPEDAKAIVASGMMRGKEDHLFFGTHPEGDIEGYGRSVVKVRLPIQDLQLDDIFATQAHVTRSAGRPGTPFKVQAELWEPPDRGTPPDPAPDKPSPSAPTPKPLPQPEKAPAASPAPQTGKPYEFAFLRNPKASAEGPKTGYGQDVEPSGRYVTEAPPGSVAPKGWETGSLRLENPLVMDFGGAYSEPSNWKRVLSERFDGKTGAALSQAVRDTGHDGIITKDKYGTSEIVDLTHLKPRAPNEAPPEPAPTVKPDLTVAPPEPTRVPAGHAEGGQFSQRATGLANQVQDRQLAAGYLERLPNKGEGIGAEEALSRGQEALRGGLDPEALARKVGEGGYTPSATEFGALLEHNRTLENRVNAARSALDAALDPKSDDPSKVPDLQKAYGAARETHQQFLDSVQKGKTEASNSFRALQAGVDLDTGNFAQVLAEAGRRRGAPVDEAQAGEFKRLTDQIAANKAREGRLQEAHAEQVAELQRQHEANIQALQEQGKAPPVSIADDGTVRVQGRGTLSRDLADDVSQFAHAWDAGDDYGMDRLAEGWGEEHAAKVVREFGALRDAGHLDEVVRQHRDWLAEQEVQAMERDRVALSPEVKGGDETLRDKISSSMRLVQRKFGGRRVRYYDIAGANLTPEEKARLSQLTATPGRSERQWNTATGRHYLSGMIEEGSLPYEIGRYWDRRFQKERAAPAPRTPRESVRQRRLQVLKTEESSIKDELARIASEALGKVHSVGSAVYDSARYGFTLGKLVLNRIRQGAPSLDEAIEHALEHLKGLGVAATREDAVRDIWELTAKERQPATAAQVEASRRARLVSQAVREAGGRGTANRPAAPKPAMVKTVPTPAERAQQAEARLERQREALRQRVAGLEAGEPPKAKGPGPEPDAELKRLRSRVRDLEKVYHEQGMEPARTIRQASARQRQLEKQIADLKAGVGRTPPPARAPLTDRIAALEKERDALTGQRRDARTVAEAQAQVDELQRQIRENDLKGLPQRARSDPSAAVELLRARRTMLGREVQRRIDLLKRTPGQRAGDAVIQATGAIRGLVLGSDVGVLARQGLFAWARPGIAGKALAPAVRAALSEHEMGLQVQRLEERQVNGQSALLARKKAGLQLTLDHPSHEEEMVMTRLAKKLPFGIGNVAGGLEMFQTTWLNTVRADLFDQGLAQGFTPAELKQRAEFINSSTGRSNVKEVPRWMRAIMTSPRYEASRWEMLARPFKDLATLRQGGGQLNRAAAANLRDMAVTTVGMVALFKAAELAGYSVNWNPTSADFLKMRRGDDVWDTTVGISPRLRDAIRLYVYATHPTYRQNVGTVVQGAVMRTITPGIRVPGGLVSTKLLQIQGVPKPIDPFSGYNEGERGGWITLLPQVFSAAFESGKAGGIGPGVAAGAQEFIGTSASHYPKSKADQPAQMNPFLRAPKPPHRSRGGGSQSLDFRLP